MRSKQQSPTYLRASRAAKILRLPMFADRERTKRIDIARKDIPIVLLVDRPPHLRAKLDREQLVPEERVTLMRDAGLEDCKRVFELPDALAHLRDLAMQLLRVREDEPRYARDANRNRNRRSGPRDRAKPKPKGVSHTPDIISAATAATTLKRIRRPREVWARAHGGRHARTLCLGLQRGFLWKKLLAPRCTMRCRRVNRAR